MKFSCRCGANTLELPDVTGRIPFLEERDYLDRAINECTSGKCKPIDRTVVIEPLVHHEDEPTQFKALDSDSPLVGKRRGRKPLLNKISRIPDPNATPKRRGRKPLSDEEKEQRRLAYLEAHPNAGNGRGRPKGSKNKKTLLKQQGLL